MLLVCIGGSWECKPGKNSAGRHLFTKARVTARLLYEVYMKLRRSLYSLPPAGCWLLAAVYFQKMAQPRHAS